MDDVYAVVSKHINPEFLTSSLARVHILRELVMPSVEQSAPIREAVEQVCAAIESGDENRLKQVAPAVRKIGSLRPDFAIGVDAAAFAALAFGGERAKIFAALMAAHAVRQFTESRFYAKYGEGPFDDEDGDDPEEEERREAYESLEALAWTKIITFGTRAHLDPTSFTDP